jgi:hypothetical protein
MSNYRTTTVRSVNKCQKNYSNPHTIPKKTTTYAQCIPARVVNSTDTDRAAVVNGTNARLPRNSVTPAAADPARQEQHTGTSAVMGPGASKMPAVFLWYDLPAGDT